ncbi:uncharacterized protein LOC131600261 [Vicia villosa]|uniref:uncharacterized protein LOC131600261 n=1 Tax=Vicia villosa TaxID=3911 RepID=UPI00273C15D4|nr:uncharacterized protein LOC131600261 [Vicia villosa]
MPLSGEAALRREIEKEQIRREILRRIELEEEVRRELAMEKELGISLPRPLMTIPGLMSHWSNTTVMNPAAVAHIGVSQPPSVLPPAEINPSSEINDKGKVIVLDKPDPDLFNAKRKATTPPVSEIEPFAFSLKKKPKEEWSCALCDIKATSESGLNAHLNGKKHKAREAGKNRKIARRNKKNGKNVMATQTVVATTELEVDAEKDQQLLQPCTALAAMNEIVATTELGVDAEIDQQLHQPCTALDAMNEIVATTVLGVDAEKDLQLLQPCTALKAMNEIVANTELGIDAEKDLQLLQPCTALKAMNDIAATTELGVDAEKDQQILQPCTALEPMNEIVVDKVVEESKKEEQLVNTVADNDTSTTESKNEKFVAMMVGKNITDSKIEEQLEGETVADNGASEYKLEEMIVSNDVIKFKNGGLLVEKSQSAGCLESKKDAAIVEAEKISASTKRRKVESLWCDICQISTFSKAVMEGHVKGKKHIKKMKKFGQNKNNASPPSTSSVSQSSPMLIKDA